MLRHWEYWPTFVVYFPVSFYLIALGIKKGALFFFNAVNPGMQNGGFLWVSKWEIYNKIKDNSIPRTFFCNSAENEENLNHIAEKLGYPLVAKPDVGVKGRGVAIVANKQELRHYHQTINADYVLQEKINYANEVGIFYLRIPEMASGIITGIVAKEFISITGNGKNTIEELLEINDRYFLQLESLKKILNTELLKQVLPAGEKKTLLSIGNHARGARFTDLSSKISPALTETIDRVCKNYPGFYYGRLDVLFDSWEKLEKGMDFKVIEFNGAHSEPTHMYDPSHSLFFAWKEITRHWKMMAKIAHINHLNGVKYLSFKEGLTLIRQFKQRSKKESHLL